jgi:hypothetical protein
VPYKRANVQRGSQYRTAWKSTRKKVVDELNRQLDLAKEGRDAARTRELKDWIKMAESATGHWGRHSMISRAILQGMSDRQIMGVSGHRSPQMFARYAHLRDNDAKELAEMVSVRGKNRRRLGPKG